MKKVICLLVALVLCASVVFTVAVADGFVESITYKGSPELVKPDGTGMNIVLHDDKDVKDSLGATDDGCLLITSVAEAKTTTKLSEEARELLLKVYEELSEGTMVLPYDKVEGIDADKMVIRELLDVSLVCDHPHKEELKKNDVAIVLSFDLGVEEDAVLSVMTYVDGEWVPAVKVTNNGDGTVTCVLEDLCPVAFSIEASGGQKKSA